MQRRRFLVKTIECTLAGAGAVSLAGCGTLFYSERLGQPHSSRIDWKIAALDALGLILFFVPGVIAFVVDFSTGAIYLPADEYYADSGTSPPHRPDRLAFFGLRRLTIPRHQLQQARIEQVATHHAGQPVCLDGGEARLSRLAALEQFDEQLARHQADRNFGLAFDNSIFPRST